MGVIGKLGGRKFLVALITLVGVVIASLTGFDIGPYKDTVTNVLAAYLIGQGLSDGLSGGKTATAVQPPSDAG